MKSNPFSSMSAAWLKVWPACSAARLRSRSCRSGGARPGRWPPAGWERWRWIGSARLGQIGTSAGSESPKERTENFNMDDWTEVKIKLDPKAQEVTRITQKRNVRVLYVFWWTYGSLHSLRWVRLRPRSLTSMTNWPEYVPVMVELWPAARIPTAQM